MKRVILGMIGLMLSPRIVIIVLIGLIPVSYVVTKVILPCGWLDNTPLIHSGCTLQINQEIAAKIVGFTPDGDNLLTSSFDGKLRLWRVTDGTLARVVLDEEYTSTRGEALSSDGRTVAVPLAYGVQLWGFDDGRPSSRLNGGTGTGKVTFSSSGNFIAAAVFGRNPQIPVWQVTDGKLLHTLEGHTSYVNKVAISPDETILASGASDNTVRLWRISDGVLLHTLEGHKYSVEDVVFSPDGITLASGDGDIRLWRVEDGTLLRTMIGGLVDSLAFSPDGTVLASGGEDGMVRLWRVKDGTLLRTVRQKFLMGGAVRSLTFSPNGTKLALALGRGPVRIFDVQQMLKQ
jgi:WD40 repeat protein